MKRMTLVYVLVAAMAAMAIMAVAQGPGNRPGGGPGMCSAECQKALGLSQTQVADMAKIRKAFMDDTATLRADLQAKMQEIAGLWKVANPDLGLIKQRAAEADLIRAQIRDKAIDMRGAVLGVLTPEQRAKCLERCQSGQCGQCGCGACGMGMGMCGMGPGGMGQGCMGGGCGMMGPGAGMGPKKSGGQGMGPGAGPGSCGGGVCPLRR